MRKGDNWWQGKGLEEEEERKDGFCKAGSKHKKKNQLSYKVEYAKINIFKAHNTRNYTTDGNLTS